MAPRWKPILRRIRKPAGWLLALLVGLPLLLLGAVQVDPVGRAVLRGILHRTLPDSVTADVGHVSGSWIGSLVLEDVEVDRGDRFALTVDTLRLVYRPLGWRWGRLEVRSALVAGLHLRVAPQPPAEAPEETEEDGPGGWSVALGELELRRGEARVEVDSGSFRAHGASLRASDVRWSDGGLVVGRWRTATSFAPTGREDGWGRAEAEGTLAPPVLVLDTVALTSPDSRVAGSGRLRLDETLMRPGGATWSLESSPLALSDLRGLVAVPGVLAGDRLFLTTSAQAEGDTSRIRLEARTDAGARVTASADLGRSGELVGGRIRVVLSEVEPRRYLGDRAPPGALAMEVDGEAEGRLSSGGLRELRASTDLRLTSPQVTLAGEARFSRSEAASDTALLRLSSLRWDRVELAESRILLSGRPDSVSWSVRVQPEEGGVLSARGLLRGASDDAPLRYAGRVEMDGVLDPFSGSLLNGSAGVEGRSLDWADLQASVRMDLTSSRLAGWAVDSLRMTGEVDGGSGSVAGRFAGPRGAGEIEAGFTSGPRGGEVRIRRMAVDSLSPLPDSAGAAPIRLTAVAEGTLRWPGDPSNALDPREVEAEVVIRSPGSRWGPVRLDSTWVDGRWRGGAVQATVRSRLGTTGEVDAELTGEVMDSRVLVVDEARFRSVPLDSLWPGAPAAFLTGRVSGRYRLPAGDSLGLGEAQLELEPTAIRGDTIRSLSAGVRVARDTLTASLRADLAGGTVEVDGRGERGNGERAWSAEAAVDLPRLGAFFARPDTGVALVGHATASGEAGTTRGEATILSATGWGARVDTLLLTAALDSRFLSLDTLLLRSNVLDLAGGGRLPARLLRRSEISDSLPLAADSSGYRIALQGSLGDSATSLRLGPDRTLLAQPGSLRVTAGCDERECAIDGRLELGPLVVGDYSAASTTLRLDGSLESGLRLRELDGRFEVLGVRTPSARIRRASVDAELVDGLLALDATSVLDDRRDLEIGLDVDPAPDRRRIAIRDLRFRMDDDQWELTRPATLRYGGPGLQLDSLEIAAADQRLLVTGNWNGPEGHDFLVRLDSMRVGTVADLLGAPELDGWLDVTVDGYGDQPQPRLEIFATGALRHRDRPLHRLRIQADKGDDFVAMDAGFLDGDRRRLRISGDLPLDSEAAVEWNMDLIADSLPLDWIGPYLPREMARGLRGSADAELAIRGERETPTASGPLSVRAGRVVLPPLGIELRDMQVDATLDRRTLSLESVRARSGGPLSMEGSVRLPSLSDPLEMELEVSADEFLAMNTRSYQAVVNGDLAVTGTSRLPRIDGSIRVLEANIRLDEGLGGENVEDVSLSDEDWATLQTRFGIPRRTAMDPGRGLETMALDLDVALGRDIWLRQDVNPEMAVQFTGDFSVEKAAQAADLDLQGEIEAIPERSYLEQFGRRFQLQEGSVLLRGPPESTYVDLASEYRVPPRDADASEVSIRLRLVGEPGDLSLTLSSSPTMENSDIVSYLATGRPASRALSGGGGETSVTGIGTEVVASQLTGLLEQFAMRDVGLDVVEIQRDGLRGATLVAGQYVTPELFLGFRQPVSFGQSQNEDETGPGQTEAEVEWRAFRWLLLHLETGGEAFRFFLETSVGY